MLALAFRFRYACSATPIKRLIDQMNRFVPPSGIEPASTVLQTVALPFKLQRRMPSNRGRRNSSPDSTAFTSSFR